MSNNSAWEPEGITPGQPAHSEEWETQRHKLFDIIHRVIDLGFSLAEVKEAALNWNQSKKKPFADWDVLGMCRWAWRKWAHEDSNISN